MLLMLGPSSLFLFGFLRALCRCIRVGCILLLCGADFTLLNTDDYPHPQNLNFNLTRKNMLKTALHLVFLVALVFGSASAFTDDDEKIPCALCCTYLSGEGIIQGVTVPDDRSTYISVIYAGLYYAVAVPHTHYTHFKAFSSSSSTPTLPETGTEVFRPDPEAPTEWVFPTAETAEEACCKANCE